MTSSANLEELLRHLCETTRLTRDETVQVLDEVFMYFSEPMPDFVARRHRELQAVGFSNDTIYRRIIEELDGRRFPAPTLSLRQVRRLIYG